MNTTSGLPFARATRDWFAAAFAAPTPVQLQAWRAIDAGENALVIAPTGSGKTLAAFLHAIDRLAAGGTEAAAATAATACAALDESGAAASATAAGARNAGTRVLYISPVKALAADVRKNLGIPLAGIDARRAELGLDPHGISVGMRTGDTPPNERARLVRRPPDMLVTTPESLYLMLSSRTRETLRGVDTVIVDEVHSVAGTKRGAHLAVSLERLDDLVGSPVQRIGLSATVSPEAEVAAFLGGPHPVRIVHPQGSKAPQLDIIVAVEDLGDIAAGSGSTGGTSELSESAAARAGSIWPHIEAQVLDRVLDHGSTIVFVNSRGLAERLAARLNELHAERLGQPFPEARHSASGPTTGRTEDGDRPRAGRTSDPPAERDSVAASATAAATSTTAAESPIIARAHHGSISREQRLLVENQLKSGELRCVVATGSLELGIDMGAVDLVIQIAPPPDVASGLQRVGRANHRVDGVARGLIFPRTRRDLVQAQVIAERMSEGLLEPLSPPRNPLDVLAQHTVSAVAIADADSAASLTADSWFTTVRRAHPFTALSRRSFDSVLAMLSGAWTTREFAGLRPSIVFNRSTGELHGRPGAQRLAVTNAGTIPDRGAYSVVLPAGVEDTGNRRVGELDEEMVHESRVGDIITLGASAWRIQEIATNQVVVVPAPGRSSRLPFWHGDGPGRPLALGRAMGAFVRTASTQPATQSEAGAERVRENRVRANTVRFLDEQREATDVVPGDTDLVLEVCPDETGDQRLVLHSPFGRRVHAPWALALSERLLAAYGSDASVMAADDGIVARIPADAAVPDARFFQFDPESLSPRIERLVGGSALFAARFRECASRALLLPRRDPGKRTPLWQQRQRAGQLLEALAEFPDFPILTETARECLHDVYDLPGLQDLMRELGSGHILFHVKHTRVPSPFAGDLLFGYVGEFLYDSDRPLAERRAGALALDPALLAELLGSPDAEMLLDPRILARIEAELQRLAPDRRARGMEGVADLLRDLGPLDTAQLAARLRVEEGTEVFGYVRELASTGRAIPVRIAGQTAWAAAEDAGRLRAALGEDTVPSTPGAGGAGANVAGVDCVDRPTLPTEFLNQGPDPMGDLVARFARTHGTFTTSALARAFGLGPAVVEPVLRGFRDSGTLIAIGAHGQVPDTVPHAAPGEARKQAGGPSAVWIDAEVFARVRRSALRAAREATRPAPAPAFTSLLLERQFITHPLHGADGLARVIEQLDGLALPASLWESQILPARVADYGPHLLDELLAEGSVTWVPVFAGDAAVGARASGTGAAEPLISLRLQDLGPVQAVDPAPLTPLQEALLDVLASGGAWSAAELGRRADTGADAVNAGADPGAGPGARAGSASATAAEPLDADALFRALWGLAARGAVVTESFAPVRGLAEFAADGSGRGAHGSAAGGTAGRGARRSGRRGRSGRAAGRYGASAYGSAYRSLPGVGGAGPGHEADGSGRIPRNPFITSADPRRRGRWALSPWFGDEPNGDGIASAGAGPTAESSPDGSAEQRIVERAEAMLDRYGVVTRAAAVHESVPGGFPALARALTAFEDAGRAIRGRFVAGLGGSQYAEHQTVDRLRDLWQGLEGPVESAATAGAVYVLAANDPANPYGVGLAWPQAGTWTESETRDGTGHCAPPSEGEGRHVPKPNRAAGALLVLDPHAGAVAWLARGGKHLVTFTERQGRAAEALLAAFDRYRLPGFVLETIDDRPALGHPWAEALQRAGLRLAPRGLRYYGN